ncbi:hypothetical protein DFH07DRAFT_956235 [Mycena maculata]|uniref:Uncharacterized protein n=1 Tax=Mycena maculata TaxID=230809 RepID=A0AAD7JJQ0_9AGAR|nr:hypothetical protein DFH07DRAFT_956235 [Mycena maculata]
MARDTDTDTVDRSEVIGLAGAGEDGEGGRSDDDDDADDRLLNYFVSQLHPLAPTNNGRPTATVFPSPSRGATETETENDTQPAIVFPDSSLQAIRLVPAGKQSGDENAPPTPGPTIAAAPPPLSNPIAAPPNPGAHTTIAPSERAGIVQQYNILTELQARISALALVPAPLPPASGPPAADSQPHVAAITALMHAQTQEISRAWTGSSRRWVRAFGWWRVRARRISRLTLMRGVVPQMGARVESAAVATEPAWSEHLEAAEGVYLNGVAQRSISSPPVEDVTHSRCAPEGDAKRPRRRMLFER